MRVFIHSTIHKSQHYIHESSRYPKTDTKIIVSLSTSDVTIYGRHTRKMPAGPKLLLSSQFEDVCVCVCVCLYVGF